MIIFLITIPCFRLEVHPESIFSGRPAWPVPFSYMDSSETYDILKWKFSDSKFYILSSEEKFEGKMMKEHTTDKLITELMKKCGLGAVIFPIEPVSGGLMHKMYRVRTDCGIYAVKHLNPKIMAREGVHENFERAEKIEYLLEKENIPIVPAITVNGKKMQNVNGHYFYIFNWQDGHITDWNNISNEECNIAGNILGKIHAINPQNISHKTVIWQRMIIVFGHIAVCLAWHIPG